MAVMAHLVVLLQQRLHTVGHANFTHPRQDLVPLLLRQRHVHGGRRIANVVAATVLTARAVWPVATLQQLQLGVFARC